MTTIRRIATAVAALFLSFGLFVVPASADGPLTDCVATPEACEPPTVAVPTDDGCATAWAMYESQQGRYSALWRVARGYEAQLDAAWAESERLGVLVDDLSAVSRAAVARADAAEVRVGRKQATIVRLRARLAQR